MLGKTPVSLFPSSMERIIGPSIAISTWVMSTLAIRHVRACANASLQPDFAGHIHYLRISPSLEVFSGHVSRDSRAGRIAILPSPRY